MNEGFNKNINLVLEIAEECVSNFRIGDEAKGFEKLVEFVDAMQILLKSFAQIQMDDEVKGYISKLNNLLLQIIDAMSSKDSVLISDIMEYELIPMLMPLK